MEVKTAKNNEYTLIVTAPLLRAGMEISTVVSEGYVVSAAEKLMRLVREINQGVPNGSGTATDAEAR